MTVQFLENGVRQTIPEERTLRTPSSVPWVEAHPRAVAKNRVLTPELLQEIHNVDRHCFEDGHDSRMSDSVSSVLIPNAPASATWHSFLHEASP